MIRVRVSRILLPSIYLAVKLFKFHVSLELFIPLDIFLLSFFFHLLFKWISFFTEYKEYFSSLVFCITELDSSIFLTPVHVET